METEPSNNIVQIIAILAPTILALASILTNIYLAIRNNKLEKHKLEYTDRKDALTSVIETLNNAQSSFQSAKILFDMMGPEAMKQNTKTHDMNNPAYKTLIHTVTVTPMEIRKVIGKNLLFFTNEVTTAINEYKSEILNKIPDLPLEDMELLQKAIDSITSNYQSKLDNIVMKAKQSMDF